MTLVGTGDDGGGAGGGRGIYRDVMSLDVV